VLARRSKPPEKIGYLQPSQSTPQAAALHKIVIFLERMAWPRAI